MQNDAENPSFVQVRKHVVRLTVFVFSQFSQQGGLTMNKNSSFYMDDDTMPDEEETPPGNGGGGSK